MRVFFSKSDALMHFTADCTRKQQFCDKQAHRVFDLSFRQHTTCSRWGMIFDKEVHLSTSSSIFDLINVIKDVLKSLKTEFVYVQICGHKVFVPTAHKTHKGFV